MQIRRLESLLDRRLLKRTGRGVVPTLEGELFLSYATRILMLGDDAVARLHGSGIDGVVRIGLPEEIAIAALPAALGRFHRAHPNIRFDVLVDNTAIVETLWREGKLDIMIGTPSAVPADALNVWNVELRWVCGLDYAPHPGQALDLVVFAEPCTWRRRMIDALAAAGRNYRIAFTSPSVAAVQAAVENGLGIALLNPECIRSSTMRHPPVSAGVPDLLVVQYGLYAQDDRPAVIDAAIDALLQGVPSPAAWRDTADSPGSIRVQRSNDH
ncbi:MAG: LysR substrate-binding domain-containing protein [Steroidobacteraceae bacterium]